MNIIEESVQKMEEIIHDTGCEDGAVELRRNPGAVPCQFERGTCIEACYGGKTAEFVTGDPVEATTRISFMFGASLTTPKMKGAACAILNVLSSFLCLARNVRACGKEDHPACLGQLQDRFFGRRIFIVGDIPLSSSGLAGSLVSDPRSADLILVGSDGLSGEDLTEVIRSCSTGAEIVCIGPSTAGFAGIQRIERFCPYGK